MEADDQQEQMLSPRRELDSDGKIEKCLGGGVQCEVKVEFGKLLTSRRLDSYIKVDLNKHLKRGSRAWYNTGTEGLCSTHKLTCTKLKRMPLLNPFSLTQAHPTMFRIH